MTGIDVFYWSSYSLPFQSSLSGICLFLSVCTEITIYACFSFLFCVFLCLNLCLSYDLPYQHKLWPYQQVSSTLYACIVCVFFPELNYLPPIYLSEGYSWMGCDSKATGATTYLFPIGWDSCNSGTLSLSPPSFASKLGGQAIRGQQQLNTGLGQYFWVNT